MEILITGATGFLGKRLSDSLAQNGHSINVLIHKTPSNSGFSKVTLDQALIKLANGDYDVVVHCATSYGRDGRINSVLESNLILPLRILDSIQNKSTVFINIDSFFNKNVSQYYTLPHYSLSKKSLLVWLEYYSKFIRVINFRLEHLYGNGDAIDKFVTRAIHEIAIEKKTIFELTNGTQKRDFIHVSDVCSAMVTLIQNIGISKTGFDNFEIGTGNSTSIRSFVELVKAISGSNTELKFGAIKNPLGDMTDSYANSDFREKYNWQPKISLDMGIQSIIKNESL